MKTKRVRLLRLALIVSVVMVAAGITGETRSTKADPLTCHMQYTWQYGSCGTPESCAPEDLACYYRNQEISACQDRAMNTFFTCMGFTPVGPPDN